MMRLLAALVVWSLLTTHPFLRPAIFAQVRDGFKRYGWGSSLQSMQQPFDLQLVQTRGEYQQFETNVCDVENVSLQSCRFEFVDERFSGIVMLLGGRPASRKLFDLLRRTYGDEVQTSPVGYQWLSRTTHVFYDEDRIGNAYVYIYSVEYQGDPEHLPERLE